jgi:myosin heavy subunit
VNYGNELLVGVYRTEVIDREKETCLREGLDWKEVDFPTNTRTMSLMSQPLIGLLPLLDDQVSVMRYTLTRYERFTKLLTWSSAILATR